MNPLRKTSQALIPIILMAGCATYDDPKDYQPSTASSDTGRVCLYRMASRQTPGFWLDWVLDGRWRGQVRPDRYYCMNTHVGRHVVRVVGSEKKLEFTLEKDQDAFIRFEVDPSFLGTFFPVSVDQKTAKEELKSKGFDIDHRSTAP